MKTRQTEKPVTPNPSGGFGCVADFLAKDETETRVTPKQRQAANKWANKNLLRNHRSVVWAGVSHPQTLGYYKQQPEWVATERLWSGFLLFRIVGTPPKTPKCPLLPNQALFRYSPRKDEWSLVAKKSDLE